MLKENRLSNRPITLASNLHSQVILRRRLKSTQTISQSNIKKRYESQGENIYMVLVQLRYIKLSNVYGKNWNFEKRKHKKRKLWNIEYKRLLEMRKVSKKIKTI